MPKHFVDVVPIPETVKHKTDNLEWESIPAMPCDLEYRLNNPIPWTAAACTMAMVGGVSLLSPFLTWAIGRFAAPYLHHWQCAAGSFLVGIVLMVWRQRRQTRGHPRGKRGWLAFPSLRLLLGPFLAWLAVAMTDQLNTLAGALAYAVLLAIPCILAAADNLATHAVYWMTANIRVDHATMVSWRKDWRLRFITGPRVLFTTEETADQTAHGQFEAVWQARLNYATGALWLWAAVLLPQTFMFLVGCGTNPNTVGIQVVLGAVFGLLIAAIVRTNGRLVFALRTWNAMWHWLHYGDGARTPPWVFQSPCGSLTRRRLICAIAIAMLSATLTHLVGGSVYRLTIVTNSHASTAWDWNNTRTLPNHPASATDLPPLASPPAFLVVLGFAAIVGVTFIPPALFFLAAVIVVGPVVVAYHDALEDD